MRSAPDVAATRTGRGLMPGDEVLVLERRRVDDPALRPGGRAFLRLADGGWADSRLDGGVCHCLDELLLQNTHPHTN